MRLRQAADLDVAPEVRHDAALHLHARGDGFAGEVQLGVLFVNAGYDVAMSDVFDGERFATNPRVNFYHAAAGVRLVLAK